MRTSARTHALPKSLQKSIGYTTLPSLWFSTLSVPLPSLHNYYTKFYYTKFYYYCYYSGTLPYNHLVNTTTSLLRPLFFDAHKQLIGSEIVLYLSWRHLKETSYKIWPYPVINTTRLLWPVGGRINGVPLYCRGDQVPWLPVSYQLCNFLVLAVGVWSIASPANEDASQMASTILFIS